MAFTTAEQLKIRQYLGYPSIHRYRDTRLEGAIEVVGTDSDAATAARALLVKVGEVDDALVASLSTAGLKRADEVEWYPGTSQNGTATLDAQRSEGRRYCSRLSQLMGVPLYGDYFGRQGYPGDAYMGIDHQYGGPIRLG